MSDPFVRARAAECVPPKKGEPLARFSRKRLNATILDSTANKFASMQQEYFAHTR